MIITHSLSSLSERNYCKLHVNNSRYDVTMPLKIEKNALSFSSPVCGKERNTSTSSKKTPAFTVFLSVCVETRLQTVTQWILNGVRSLWGFAKSGVEITGVTLNGLRMSLSKASNMQQLWSEEESCVPLHSKTFVTHFTALNAAPALPPFLLLPPLIFKQVPSILCCSGLFFHFYYFSLQTHSIAFKHVNWKIIKWI